MILAVIYFLTMILFVLLMLSLSFQPKFITRLTGIILLFTGISGVILYGYGYAVLIKSVPQAVMRTLFSVFGMFLGRNEIGTISAVPLLARPGMQVYLYAIHLLALYTTASAVIATLGTRLIRTLRLFVIHFRDLDLIYGANEDSISFAEKLMKEKRRTVVFADSGNGSGYDSRILRMGSLLLSGEEAKRPNAAFLRKIGIRPGKCRLTVYCLDPDLTENLHYAKAMRDALEQAGIRPDQTALTALLEEETAGEQLQNTEKHYGFGSVLAIEQADLLARLMIRLCPPWEQISFDREGCAEEDFEAVIIGFGNTGKAALRRLAMNAQFAGSRFRATVISPEYTKQAGSFFDRYPGLKSSYDLSFLEMNARSIAAYEEIEKRIRHLNYVAICTGSEKENTEIAVELSAFLEKRKISAPILLISHRGVGRFTGDGDSSEEALYVPDILCSSRLDAMAMEINHAYHRQEGHSAEEDWRSCDYFSRMSCRASADYLDAFLRAAGTDRDGVLQGGWKPEGALLENLSISEHLRWCAFHYAMGYQTMPESVFHARADQWKNGDTALRIGKDTENRLHACLIPWDELDELSRRETEITGKAVDYKESDRVNVRAVCEILRAE